MSTLADIGSALAVFAVTVAIATLLGAADLGTALGIGQIAFVLAACFVMLRN